MTDIGMEAKKKKWSGKVTKKETYHTPDGLFSKPAEDIAKTLKKDSDSRKQAMARLNFYKNRAGKNLSKKDKEKLELAKVILKRLYDEEDKKNKKVSNEAFDDVTEPMVDEPPSSMW